MPSIIVKRYPAGPRLWVAGQRIHHGAVGCAMMAGAVRAHQVRRRILAVALVLIAHDRHDARAWFRRDHLGAL